MTSMTSPSAVRKKDDADDARIFCLLALDRHAALKTLIPHGEIGGELRAIGRDDDRAARDQRRLLNRLRADLQTTYPAALTLASKDLGAPTVLRLLERWPTQTELAVASREDLVSFARAGRHGWPDRFADQVTTALAQPSLPTSAGRETFPRRAGPTSHRTSFPAGDASVGRWRSRLPLRRPGRHSRVRRDRGGPFVRPVRRGWPASPSPWCCPG